MLLKPIIRFCIWGVILLCTACAILESPREPLKYGKFIPVPEQYRQCESDDECYSVINRCGGCTCGVGINEDYFNAFSDLKEEQCKDHQGMICRMDCNDRSYACVQGVCEIISSGANRK